VFLAGREGLRLPLGSHDLPVDGFLDLGLISVPPPVRLQIKPPEGVDCECPNLRIMFGNGRGDLSAELHGLTGWPSAPIEAFPGEHYIALYSGDWMSELYWFDVPSQAEFTVVVPKAYCPEYR
jgi:hypothetical protein